MRAKEKHKQTRQEHHSEGKNVLRRTLHDKRENGDGTKNTRKATLQITFVWFDGTTISSVFSTCPLNTISGCGKERRILIGPC